ncbi:unnamed protein product [Urochloa decumbens]|uniref:Phytosulfokine-beta n=1 Tax=Urochloa decumbens TaxID=240449 RepID=A0ABC9H556_9POAL
MMTTHGRRMAAVALVCLLCLLVAPLLAQGAQPSSRKLLWTVPEKPSHDGSGSGSHGTDDGTTTTTPEPCSGDRGSESRGSAGTGEAGCDTARWAEIHTDYIYTQDVKHP